VHAAYETVILDTMKNFLLFKFLLQADLVLMLIVLSLFFFLISYVSYLLLVSMQ